MSSKRAIVILNRGSGRQNGDQAESTIRAAFARHGITAEFIHIDKRNDPASAARQALSMAEGIIAVAGGDGTISGVSSAMKDQDRPLGIIPQGTFNYFARSMGIPEDLQEAVDVIAGGESRAVHVATINGETFLNNASIGAYPAILKTRRFGYDGKATVHHLVRVEFGPARLRRLQIVFAICRRDLSACVVKHDRLASAGADVHAHVMAHDRISQWTDHRSQSCGSTARGTPSL